MKHTMLIVALGVLVAGCGGGGGTGGGGTGGGSIPTVQFTSWSDLRPNTEIVAPAISTEANYTENLAGRVTSVGDFSSWSGIEFRETFGADGSVTKASFTTGDGDRLVFDQAQGAFFAPIMGGFATFAQNASETAFALAVDPVRQGWSYQTFGIWSREQIGGNPARVGAISTGNFTPVNNVPTTGRATFGGAAAGTYLGPGGFEGESAIVRAAMGMAVDFGSRNVTFVTVNTVASTDGGQNFLPRPSLDLTGNLQVVPGQNLMVGTVSSEPHQFSGQLSGEIYGKFYGPNAQEVGGTFGLKGSGVESYVGGFGGKR